MEIALNPNFIALENNEIKDINGGGWFSAFAGCVIIGAAPLAGVLAGIGGSVVGTPALGITAGIAAASGMVAVGAGLIDGSY